MLVYANAAISLVKLHACTHCLSADVFASFVNLCIALILFVLNYNLIFPVFQFIEFVEEFMEIVLSKKDAAMV